MSISSTPSELAQAIQQVCAAAGSLITVPASVRSRALTLMAQKIRQEQDAILEANTLDLEASRDMAVSELVIDWLKLTPERLQVAISILQRLADMGDPLPSFLNSAHPGGWIPAYYQLAPLGTIALIYEAFPELGVIAAGLCCRTSNALLLKGGAEASQTNHVIVQVLQDAIAKAGIPSQSLLLLPTDQGHLLRDLLVQDHGIDLVIPYGRPRLIQQVSREAAVPVLKPSLGNCYLYWGATGSLETVYDMIVDSHRGEPDAVNSIEKVLVYQSHPSSLLNRLWNRLWEEGFRLKGDNTIVAEFPELEATSDEEWTQPYLSRTVAFKWVDGLEAAIADINAHSSRHADCIATDSYQESRQFSIEVQSASIHINASPRFSRNPDKGAAIALGMSSHEGRWGGLIGINALTTAKWVVQGKA